MPNEQTQTPDSGVLTGMVATGEAEVIKAADVKKDSAKNKESK